MAEETLRPFTLGLSVLLPIWGGHISLMRHAVTGRLKGTQGADLLSCKKVLHRSGTLRKTTDMTDATAAFVFDRAPAIRACTAVVGM